MKKLFIHSLVMALSISTAVAQWTPTESIDGNVYRNGNVGIGTATPGYKLEIQNLAGESESFLRVRVHDAPTDYFIISNSTGLTGQFIPVLQGYHDTDNRVSMQLVGATSPANDAGSHALVNFDARLLHEPVVNRPLFSWTNFNNAKMIMLPNGNLGVGTTNPTQRLHVNGGARIRKAEIGTTQGTAGNSWVRDTWLTANYGTIEWDEAKAVWRRASFTYNDFGGIIFQDEGTYLIRQAAGSKLEFTNSELLNTAYLFANMFNGYVGIGTNSPDSRLTVKGTIHTQEVKVDLNGSVAPDFVFEEDYVLPGLAETEAYIKTNKHLPDIPSAQQMEENGIDLKEMNLKLLQKVEELTLHVIEMKKEIQELKRGGQ